MITTIRNNLAILNDSTVDEIEMGIVMEDYDFILQQLQKSMGIGLLPLFYNPNTSQIDVEYGERVELIDVLFNNIEEYMAELIPLYYDGDKPFKDRLSEIEEEWSPQNNIEDGAFSMIMCELNLDYEDNDDFDKMKIEIMPFLNTELEKVYGMEEGSMGYDEFDERIDLVYFEEDELISERQRDEYLRIFYQLVFSFTKINKK